MITKSIQFCLWMVPVALLIVVGVNRADLDGDYHVHWEPGDTSPFVHGLRPTGRVQDVEVDADRITRMTGDPVYLSVTPPGNYETALVQVEVQSHGQPMVELGATVNSEAGQIDLRPVLHETIDALDWTELNDGQMRLLQRDARYPSVQEFLEAPPSLSQIATYHVDLPEPEVTPITWLNGPDYTLDSASLRGFHAFITATRGEQLVLDVTYMDMNRDPGADPVAIRVFQSGELIAEVEEEDDGVELSTNAAIGQKTLNVRATGLQEGLVKVELHGGNDIYWRTIDSSLPKMTFLSNVFVGDDVGYLPQSRPVELWTDAQHLTLFTRHAEAVGVVEVGSQRVDVAVPHEHYQVQVTEPGLVRVLLPSADMLVVTDGRVAFSPEAFFNPYPVRLDDRTDLDALGVNYILTKYQPEQMSDGWTQASATYVLGPLEREAVTQSEIGMGGSYRFVLSMPRVEEREAFVDVRSIDIYFTRPRRSLKEAVSRALSTLGL